MRLPTYSTDTAIGDHLRPRRLVVAGIIASILLVASVIAGIVYAMVSIDLAGIDVEKERARVAYEATIARGAFDPASFAHDFSLPGAHLGAPAGNEVAIATGDGMLSWMPRRLGTEVFLTLAPLRLLLSIALLGGMGFIIRRFYLLTCDLEQGRMEARDLASRDILTGLKNRLAFDETLDRMLSAPGKSCALLYLDLDDFKIVNDTMGHGAGDALLRLVAQRLAPFAGEDDLVARLGGDEFAIVVGNPGPSEELAELARDIRHALIAPFHINGRAINVGVSIGIACAPSHGITGEALVGAADKALYRAKSRRDGSFAFAVAA